jgi:hypothetical protein
MTGRRETADNCVKMCANLLEIQLRKTGPVLSMQWVASALWTVSATLKVDDGQKVNRCSMNLHLMCCMRKVETNCVSWRGVKIDLLIIL